MLTLTLLLSLLPSSHPLLCPCDVTPSICDTDCCCDVSCSAEQVLTFTCPSYPLSDSKLCCQDKLTLTPEGGYQNVRTCSNNLGCLQETPGLFGLFPEESSSDELVFSNQLGGVTQFEIDNSQTQYRDSDVLLQGDVGDSPSRFLFPVQFHGDLCAKSPIKFYSELQSSCRKKVVISELCKENTALDYRSYLTTLLSYPATNATRINLSDADTVVFYCLDSTQGVKEICSPSDPVTKVLAGTCINVVKEIQIYLTVSPDKMTLETSSVHITLTSISNSAVAVYFSQKFSISYKPSSPVNSISGNFGYVHGSPILSGTVAGTTVVMNSDSNHRILTLFQSEDCVNFGDRPIEFGVGYYTGCKLELEFYNFNVMSAEKEEYCQVLRDISTSIFNETKGIVVGTTGRASTADLTQWVYVVREPDTVTPDLGPGSTVKCSDVITHVTYKVFYTEVGDEGNLQAVITAVRVQYTTQDVVLYCSSAHCISTKPQYLVLSNSVQFHYNTPSLNDRYKVNPRTTALLPLDFFYPLTAGAGRVGLGRWAIVFLCVVWSCFR
ncbi:hypothetical protein ACHWQZ_G005168 [Mnemiopsis leidyi]